MHDRARSSFLVPFLLSCFPTGVIKTCFWSCEFPNTACGTWSIWALGVCILCSRRQMFRINEAAGPFGGFSSKSVIFVIIIKTFFSKMLKLVVLYEFKWEPELSLKPWELHLPFMVVWAWPASITRDFSSLPHSIQCLSSCDPFAYRVMKSFLYLKWYKCPSRKVDARLTFNNERQWNYFCLLW